MSVRVSVEGLPVPLEGAPRAVLDYPSLVSDPEKTLLYRLARDYYTGQGGIVDAGIFLGGSTNAFAIGLRENRNRAARRRIRAGHKPITSYELAVFVEGMRRYIGRDAFRAKLGDWNPAHGESFEPLLRALLASSSTSSTSVSATCCRPHRPTARSRSRSSTASSRPSWTATCSARSAPTTSRVTRS
jgi:hypothetical protein